MRYPIRILGSTDGSGILVNLDGEIVGIIAQSYSAKGNNVVTGIAISQIKKLIENLSNNVSRAYIGIRGQDVTEELSDKTGIPKGVLISRVADDSPAMMAGMKVFELKAMIERHIPDCRVCIGHGQMEPAELEKIIFDFVNYDYDVLLATTIIESGIDIPNANTIIINQAQNFGLSDLHQMRGRVGRSNKKAFCYLLAPPLSSLTPEAKRRLQAIENFSDLGSGIHIAMQDLDIRGAGNMLGAEQSGFIADLGYETYQKILSEAVHELKTDEFADLYAEELKADGGVISGEQFVDECQVESDLELLLPADYVTGSSERMLLYRELDGLTLDKDVDAFRSRLEDRFGPIPPETEELLRIVPLRRLAARLGVEKVFLKGGRMSLFFVSNPDSPYYQSQAFGKVIAYMMKYTRRCDLREQNNKRSMLVKDVRTVEEAVCVLQEVVAMQVEE